jgi:hypothetical protein
LFAKCERTGFHGTLLQKCRSGAAIKLILDNHSAHISKETRAWLADQPAGRFEFVFTPTHGSALYAAVILRCEHAASKSAFTCIFDALWLHASLEG